LVRELLLYFGPSHTPTRSDVETLFFELVRHHGLPDPERQVVIADEKGFIGTVDFAWRSARLVVEVDSTWHDGPLDQVGDAERDQRLRAIGYTVRRYRFDQIVAAPGAITRELAAILSG